MFRRPARALACLVLSATVAATSLTACGVGSQNDSGTAGTAEETSFDSALSAFTEGVGGDGEDGDGGDTDPREFTGTSTAETVGDVTPAEGAEDAEPDLPVELTDADGEDVTVDDVSRIIPLDIYGTISRTLAGLGLRDNIVGRTVSSLEPSLEDLPVVTQGGHSINAEAVLNLDPSLVIVDGSIGPSEAISQLRDSGVSVVKISPDHTIDTVGDDINTLASIVGLPEVGKTLAKRSEDEIDQAVEAISDATPEEPLRMAFLYARGDGGIFYILGPDDGTSDLIESLGGVDAAKEEGIGKASPANAEALADLDPEVIVMMSEGLESTGGVDGLLAKPGISQTTAGEKSRILSIPDSQSLSFGPQSGEMLLTAAAALYQG
ncbi:MAG TPA: ABC transporter substrate-binding protein [Candidatus Corynebacterium avicola]|uniref:ABC transporter substrate-binding protein n=1 Tax=Candidatus Corynebacterium avicola TaxID=2838527 RepID=A0A9D1RPK8_9CORY|nr:ABC transporter substrate-binding protein [Candidatus Corynebacterium avicola]